MINHSLPGLKMQAPPKIVLVINHRESERERGVQKRCLFYTSWQVSTFFCIKWFKISTILIKEIHCHMPRNIDTINGNTKFKTKRYRKRILGSTRWARLSEFNTRIYSLPWKKMNIEVCFTTFQQIQFHRLIWVKRNNRGHLGRKRV